MADANGVLVIGQTTGDSLDSTAAELLAAGRALAATLGEELSIGLLGDTLDAPAQQAIAQGADRGAQRRRRRRHVVRRDHGLGRQ